MVGVWLTSSRLELGSVLSPLLSFVFFGRFNRESAPILLSNFYFPTALYGLGLYLNCMVVD